MDDKARTDRIAAAAELEKLCQGIKKAVKTDPDSIRAKIATGLMKRPQEEK